MVLHVAHPLPTAETMVLPVYDPVVHRHILGSTAVIAGVAAGGYHDTADWLQQNDSPEAARDARSRAYEYHTQAQEQLDAVRERIRTAAERPPILDRYLDYFLGREFDDARLTGQTVHENIVDWLGDGDRGATDEQLYDFLQRHLEYLERQQQHPEVQEVIAATRAKYIKGIRDGVAAGWLSREALHTLQKVENAKVVIGDVWDTFVQGRYAYFERGKTHVVIGQGARITWGRNDTLENIRESLLHEFSHVQFVDQHDVPIWFEEAMAEHLNQVLQHGAPNMINPIMRGDTGTYENFREFLGNILSGPDHHKRSPRLLRAALKAYTSAQDSPEWKDFMRQFDAAWGEDAFQSFESAIATEARRFEAAGKHSPDALMHAVAAESQRLWNARKRRTKDPRYEGVHEMREHGQGRHTKSRGPVWGPRRSAQSHQ